MALDLATLVPCHDLHLPDTEALRRQLQRTEPSVRVEEVIVATGQIAPGAAGRILKINDVTVAILGIPAPLPLNEVLYGPVPTLFWQTAEQDLRRQTGHVRVMVVPDDEVAAGLPVQTSARLLVRVTAALCGLIDAIGVLWCPADHAMSASRFVQIATTPESEGQMLATVWVRLVVAQTEQGLIVGTHGLAGLSGGPKLEFGPTKALDLTTLATRAMQFAHFVLNGQITLQPGETIGPEAFSITKSTGSFDAVPVLRLMPTGPG